LNAKKIPIDRRKYLFLGQSQRVPYFAKPMLITITNPRFCQ